MVQRQRRQVNPVYVFLWGELVAGGIAEEVSLGQKYWLRSMIEVSIFYFQFFNLIRAKFLVTYSPVVPDEWRTRLPTSLPSRRPLPHAPSITSLRLLVPDFINVW